MENLALDGAYRARGALGDDRRPPDILVVSVDEPSFQEIGLPWPWPRRLHALLLDRLRQAGARLVVLDMVFAEPTTPEDDAALAQALSRSGNVVLARALETVNDPAFARRVLVEPLPRFAQAAAAVGLGILTPDPDGVIRRFRTHLDGLPTLSGAAVGLLSPDGRVPDVGGLIDYPGPARTVDTVSYAQVIDPDRPLPEARLRGRVAVVGRSLAATAAPLGQAESFATPFTPATNLPSSGPEIQAAIMATLLHGRPGGEVPRSVMLPVTAALLALSGAALFTFRPLLAAGAGAGLAGGVLAAALALFAWRFVWMPPALLSIGLLAVGGAATLYRGLDEARRRRFLTRAFSRYLAPEVVRDIVNRPERLELGGEEVRVTVFFSDLAGFTSFSEALSPPELIRLLNAYFTPMTDIILASGGTLDKYIGDAIMAFWGAPLPLEDHARRAVDAALRMDERLATLRRDLSGQGLPELTARVGLHAGPAVVGNVGSRERFNYTILGDTVNLASRLESLNKQYGTRILVSQAARREAGDGFIWREVDVVRVKGRSRAVTVYEPLGRGGGVMPDYAARFEAGRWEYLRRRFAPALAEFEAALAARPDDGPSAVFAGRCRAFLADPPPPDWDGVFVPSGK